jgi:hypothetical protein
MWRFTDGGSPMSAHNISPLGVVLFFLLACAPLVAYAQTAPAVDGLRGDFVRALDGVEAGFNSEAAARVVSPLLPPSAAVTYLDGC